MEVTKMTISDNGIYFTEREAMQLRQSAEELMENTFWYLAELKRLDKKTLDMLKLLFGDRVYNK
jgi:hypothetical protein